MTHQLPRLTRTTVIGACCAMFFALAGCGRGAGSAPPEHAEGAAGMVAVDNAGAAQNPQTPALSGGPAGQTPAYPSPGGVGSVVQSGPAGPAAERGAYSHEGDGG